MRNGVIPLSPLSRRGFLVYLLSLLFFFNFSQLSISFYSFFFYFISNSRATYKFPQRLGNRQHSGSERKSGRLPPAGGQELGIWLEASAWQHEWSTEWHGSFPIVPPASHVHISELGD